MEHHQSFSNPPANSHQAMLICLLVDITKAVMQSFTPMKCVLKEVFSNDDNSVTCCP